MGDYWVIVTKAGEDMPNVHVFLPEEIRQMAHKSGKSWWVEPTVYDKPQYLNAWDRIVN